jgi:hypothetical protein
MPWYHINSDYCTLHTHTHTHIEHGETLATTFLLHTKSLLNKLINYTTLLSLEALHLSVTFPRTTFRPTLVNHLSENNLLLTRNFYIHTTDTTKSTVLSSSQQLVGSKAGATLAEEILHRLAVHFVRSKERNCIHCSCYILLHSDSPNEFLWKITEFIHNNSNTDALALGNPCGLPLLQYSPLTRGILVFNYKLETVAYLK